MGPRDDKGLMPPVSVSKAGHMSEIQTGTRQLAKIGIRSLRKKRPVPPPPLVLSTDLELDEFGTGQAYDCGRNKELVSSPREDLEGFKQVEEDEQSGKMKAFNRSMELRYDAAGNLLERPEPDPIDLKYQKFNVRRPWSSKAKPLLQPPSPLLATAATAVSETSLGKDDRTSAENPEVAEARMLAALEGFALDGEAKARSQKQSACFMSPMRDSRAIDPNATPCTGQYNPKFKIVHRAPPQPPSWGRSLKQANRSTRPHTAGKQHGKDRTWRAQQQQQQQQQQALAIEDRAAEERTLRAASNMGGTVGTVGGSSAHNNTAKTAAQPDQQEAARNLPNNFRQWVGRSRAAALVNSMRPSSAFLTRERQPLSRSETPGPYWPYNCLLGNGKSGVPMDKQPGRWVSAGYASVVANNGPDVVYNTNVALSRKVMTTNMERQIPRDRVQRSHTKIIEPKVHAFYDADPTVLSSVKRPASCLISKPRAASAMQDYTDARKSLDPNYGHVSPRVQSGVNYDTQLPRPDFLHPSDTVHLDYDVAHGFVHKRAPAVNMEWSEGHHADFIRRTAAGQADYSPSTVLVAARTDMAPDLQLMTSREKAHGSWKPISYAEGRVYDAAAADMSANNAFCGIRFEKQVGREEVPKHKTATSDMFYDHPRPKVKGVITFDKVLARNKRACTKWL